jgi:hypothetical protein
MEAGQSGAILWVCQLKKTFEGKQLAKTGRDFLPVFFEVRDLIGISSQNDAFQGTFLGEATVENFA